jgi:hypothetical protein
MSHFMNAFADELIKTAAKDPPKEKGKKKKPSILRRAATLGLGAAAGYAGYRYARKVRLSKDPLLRAMQEKSKGRLTHIDALDAGQKKTTGLRKKVNQHLRGVDEIIEETPKQWERGYEAMEYPMWHEGRRRLPKGAREAAGGKRKRKVEGATHAIGYPSQLERYKSDLRLGSNAEEILRSGSNKLEEAKFFAGAGGMAKSERADNMVRAIKGGGGPMSDGEKLDRLQASLRKRFPKGYVVKPVSGAASGGVPTHQQKWSELLKGKGDPEHARWVQDTLKNPKDYMFQEYIPIAKNKAMFATPPKSAGKVGRNIKIHGDVPSEYRVHVFGGRVVPGGSSHRWAAGQEMNPFRRKEFKEMEKFVQDNVDKLPKSRTGVPMAMDVAKTTDGKWRIIESNPGGESGFLIPDKSKTLTMAPHAVYKAVTGRSSKPVAAATGLAAGAATAVAAGQVSKGGVPPEA